MTRLSNQGLRWLLAIQLILVIFCPPIARGGKSIFASDLWAIFASIILSSLCFLSLKPDLKKSFGLEFLISAAAIFIAYVHGIFRPALFPAFQSIVAGQLPSDHFEPFRELIVASRFFFWILMGLAVKALWIQSTNRKANLIFLQRVLAACSVLASMINIAVKIFPPLADTLGRIYGYDPHVDAWADRIFGTFRSPIEGSEMLGLSVLILVEGDWCPTTIKWLCISLIGVGLSLTRTITAVIAILSAFIFSLLPNFRLPKVKLASFLSVGIFGLVLYAGWNHPFLETKKANFLFRIKPWEIFWNGALTRWDHFLFGMGFTSYFVDNIYVFLFSRGGFLLLMVSLVSFWAFSKRRWNKWPVAQRMTVFYLLVTGLTQDSWIMRPVVVLITSVAVPFWCNQDPVPSSLTKYESESSKWLRYGFLNTLEHGLTRISDAMTSFVLIWFLSAESFGKLALAQAMVAPTLLFFIAPETSIYRYFAQWKSEGNDSFHSRLNALRVFGWTKAPVALALAFIFSFMARNHEAFYALLWAFSLSLAPQISGADREYLRINLNLTEVNLISIYQKLSLFFGTIWVSLKFPSRIDLLAFAAAFSVLSTAILSTFIANYTLGSCRKSKSVPIQKTLREALSGFSIWMHLNGVALNWIQTMDLFFLGVFQLPTQVTGLYAAALKLANFSLALPTALGNLFSIWLGRRKRHYEDHQERLELKRYSALIFLGSLLQLAVIVTIAPTLIHFLAHGRWNMQDQGLIIHWLTWILFGNVIISTTLLLSSWLALRGLVSNLFRWAYLPWLLGSLLVYSTAAHWGGPDWTAKANIAVAAIHLILLLAYDHSMRKTVGYTK